MRHHSVKINNDTIQQQGKLQHVAIANWRVTPTEAMIDQFSARPKGTASPSGRVNYQTSKRNHVACEDVRNNDSMCREDPPLQKKINERQDVRAKVITLRLSTGQLV